MLKSPRNRTSGLVPDWGFPDGYHEIVEDANVYTSRTGPLRPNIGSAANTMNGVFILLWFCTTVSINYKIA